MKRMLNTAALAVVISGGWMIAHPTPASATYRNPFLTAGFGFGNGAGIMYCCQTGDTAHCCYLTGCATKPGMCVQLR